MMDHMTIDEALALYLPAAERQTGRSRPELLVMAANQAAVWRVQGPRATAAILAALMDENGMTLDGIEEITGIPAATAGRLVDDHRRS